MRGSDDLQRGNQRMWAGVKMAKVIGSVGLHERFSACLAPVSCRLSQRFPTDPANPKKWLLYNSIATFIETPSQPYNLLGVRVWLPF